MSQVLAIAAGGAAGALLRFWVSTGVYALLGRGFPHGTLAVNVLGSLLMGILYVLFMERMLVTLLVFHAFNGSLTMLFDMQASITQDHPLRGLEK